MIGFDFWVTFASDSFVYYSDTSGDCRCEKLAVSNKGVSGSKVFSWTYDSQYVCKTFDGAVGHLEKIEISDNYISEINIGSKVIDSVTVVLDVLEADWYKNGIGIRLGIGLIAGAEGRCYDVYTRCELRFCRYGTSRYDWG